LAICGAAASILHSASFCRKYCRNGIKPNRRPYRNNEPGPVRMTRCWSIRISFNHSAGEALAEAREPGPAIARTSTRRCPSRGRAHSSAKPGKPLGDAVKPPAPFCHGFSVHVE
jgi:hypothetical protein